MINKFAVHFFAIFLLIAMSFLNLACGSTGSVAEGPDNASTWYNRGLNLYQKGQYLPAAEIWQKAVEMDATYRVKGKFSWSESVASSYGIITSGKLEFSNFSLYLFLGGCYEDAAKKTGDYTATESEKPATYEKALECFMKGYEIDIINGNNSNGNLMSVYLGYISKTLERLGRTDEAAQYIAQIPVNIPERVAIPSWAKMGMGVSEIQKGVYKNKLIPDGNVYNGFSPVNTNDLWSFEIDPEKGLVCFVNIIKDYDVKSVMTILIKKYGEPVITDIDNTPVWIPNDPQLPNIESIGIYIFPNDDKTLSMGYYFSNYF